MSASTLAEPTATELSVARRLFADATSLEKQQRWELAVSKLKEAIQIKDTPGLRFHLAHCEQNLGQLVEAMLDYGRAQDLIAGGARAPDVEQLLEPARRKLEPRIPSLVIVPPADVTNLQVQIDGHPVALSVLGRPAPVNPGAHRVVVQAAGYRDFSEEVLIQEGEHRTIAVALVSSQPPPGPVPARRPEPVPGSGASRESSRPTSVRGEASSKISTQTYLLVGESVFTLAALGLGVGFLIVKNTEKDRVANAQDRIDALSQTSGNSSCTDDDASRQLRETCSDLHQAINDYDGARFFSTAGLVGTGVGVAALVLTVALWPDSEKHDLALRTDPTQRWLGLSGRF